MDQCDQYKDEIYYLQHMHTQSHLIENENRTIKFLLVRYIIVNGSFWWRNFERILLKCIDLHESEKVVNDMHSGVCGEHYMAKNAINNVIRVGFWWPSLFKDGQILVIKCHSCQRFSRKLKFSRNIPLKLVEVQASFQKLGMDFIDEISTKFSISYSWILVATDYFTKWVDAIPTRQYTSKVVNNFLLNKIITRLRCLEKIMTDNTMCFRFESPDLKMYCMVIAS